MIWRRNPKGGEAMSYLELLLIVLDAGIKLTSLIVGLNKVIAIWKKEKHKKNRRD